MEWQVGQRIVVDPGVNLFEDEYPRRGEDSLSPGYHVLGEHMRVPRKNSVQPEIIGKRAQIIFLPQIL